MADRNLEEMLSCVRESTGLRSVKEKESFVERHASSSSFLHLLQLSYSHVHWYPRPRSLEPDVLASERKTFGVDFRSLTLVRTLEMLEEDRMKSGGMADLIYSGYLSENGDARPLVDGVVGKCLFGLDCDVIDKVAGGRWLRRFDCPSPGRLKDASAVDWESHRSFARKQEGTLAVVVRSGTSCEVLSRSGRPYLMLDSVRAAFLRVPFDGAFLVQLSFVGEDGMESKAALFSETAKKVQSESWRIEVMDYSQISEWSCPPPWTDRVVMARLASRFARDERVTAVEEAGTSAEPGCYVVDVGCGPFSGRPQYLATAQ